MKLAMPNNAWMDPSTGKPVEGRMQVYLHDTNTHANLYCLDGLDYVEAANPQLLHGGLPFATMFTDIGVYDVVIEKYIGEPGSMSVYSPESDFAQIGDYETGLDFNLESMTATKVSTVSDLSDVDPSVGVVTVDCYFTKGDCPPRTYVWDAECQTQPDGGYVVSSNVSDSGAWILMWDSPVLPCSVYGVFPGNEGSINLLLNYPQQVGSFAMRTAPIVRFLPGTYGTTSSFSTAKQLMFDPGAKFTAAEFTCPKADIVGLSADYVADFTFTARDAVAHSSWFRSVTAFWFCGAPNLVIDNENNFSDLVLRGKPTVYRTVITGSTRIPMTYVNGNYLTFERCEFNAKEIFSPASDYVKFSGMRWDDRIWNDTSVSHYTIGKITQGDHIEFLASAANSVDLDDFHNAMLYVKAREAQIQYVLSASTVLDLEGRNLASFNSSRFTALKNAHVTGNITLTSAPAGFSISDVTCDGSIDGGTNIVLVNVTGSLGGEWTGSLTAYDCQLSGSDVTGAHDITVVGGRWRKSIKNATDNTANTGTVLFRDCVLDGMNAVLRTKNLNLVRCGVYEQKIEVYPYYDTVNSRFLFNGRIEHCEVNCTNPVAYKIFHGLQDNCRDCVLVYTWIGNSWFGNEKGLTMEFWADSQVLSNVIATSGHYVVYSGNSGFCPLDAWHGTHTSTSWSQCAFYPEDGELSSPLTGFYRANIDIRCCPNWNIANSAHNTTGVSFMGAAYEIAGGVTTKGYLSATNPMPASLGYGDAFEICLVRYGSAGDSTVTYV